MKYGKMQFINMPLQLNKFKLMTMIMRTVSLNPMINPATSTIP